jgi:hypothetical protein
MDELLGSGDPDVDTFVDVHLSSFAAWDIVAYFAHNPDVSVDLGELSTHLGRKESEVEPVLQNLVQHCVVTASGVPAAARYTLSADPKVRRVVSRFVEISKVRELRLEFVRRVLAGMSRD